MKKTVKSLKNSKPGKVEIGKWKKNTKKARVNIKEKKNILTNENTGKENDRFDKDIFDVIGFS